MAAAEMSTRTAISGYGAFVFQSEYRPVIKLQSRPTFMVLSYVRCISLSETAEVFRVPESTAEYHADILPSH